MAPARFTFTTAEFRRWRRTRPFWGGLLLLVAGLELFFSANLTLADLQVHFGPEGFLSYLLPVMLILAGTLTWFSPAQRLFYGILGLLAAVYSLIGLNLGGFVLGMLIGILGGALVIAWTPGTPTNPNPPPTPEPDTTPHRDTVDISPTDATTHRDSANIPATTHHDTVDIPATDSITHRDTMNIPAADATHRDTVDISPTDATTHRDAVPPDADDSPAARSPAAGTYRKPIVFALVPLMLTAAILAAGGRSPAVAAETDCPEGLPSRSTSTSTSPDKSDKSALGGASTSDSDDDTGDKADSDEATGADSDEATGADTTEATGADTTENGKGGNTASGNTAGDDDATGTATGGDNASDDSDSADTGNTSDTGDASDTADTGNTSDTADASDTGDGNPIRDGLEDLKDGLGDLLGIGDDDEASPSPSASAPTTTPTTTTPAPDPTKTATQQPSQQPSQQVPGSPSTTSPGTPAGSAQPSPAPGPSDIPCLGPRVYKKGVAGDVPRVSVAGGKLETDELTMYNSTYDGVVTLDTAEGDLDVLKFSMDKAVNVPFRLTIPERGDRTSLIVSDELTTEGNVEFYTRRFEGKLFGLIPVVFTPEQPPPLTLPELVFTDVTITLDFVTCDVLTAKPLDLSEHQN